MDASIILQDIGAVAASVFNCPVGVFYTPRFDQEESVFTIRVEGVTVTKRAMTGSDCLMSENMTLMCVYNTRLGADWNEYVVEYSKCVDFIRLCCGVEGVSQASIVDINVDEDSQFFSCLFSVIITGNV